MRGSPLEPFLQCAPPFGFGGVTLVGLLDLVELFGFLWEGKKTIVTVTTVVFLSSIFYALSLNHFYKSTSTLSVIEAVSGGGSFGGLASIAMQSAGPLRPRVSRQMASAMFLVPGACAIPS